MGREGISGAPWHYEQMNKTCQIGSKHCIYLKQQSDLCGCIPSPNYNRKCIGKGYCEDFESLGNTAKSTGDNKVYTYNPQNRGGKYKKKKGANVSLNQKAYSDKKVVKKTEVKEKMNDFPQYNDVKETEKANNFIRLAESRTDKIIKALDVLENLSNKSKYIYTDEQIDKMFAHIEDKVYEAKRTFKGDKKKIKL